MINLANTVMPEGDTAAKMFTDMTTKALQDAKATATGTPSGLASRDAAIDWIKQHVADAAQQDAALKAFDKAFLTDRAQDAAAVRTILSNASFDIGKFGR